MDKVTAVTVDEADSAGTPVVVDLATKPAT